MSPTLDTPSGEAVTVTPMIVRPNFSPELDPSRMRYEATAIFAWKLDLALGEGENRDQRNKATKQADDPLRVVSCRPVFSFASTPMPLRGAT